MLRSFRLDLPIYAPPSRFLPLGNFKEHGTKPQTLEELTDQIEHTISDSPLATIQIVCHFARRRRWECTVEECC